MSGKTPSASRAGSRYASTVDLKAQSARAGDLKKHSLKNLQAEAFTAEELDDDEDEIVERVMIRSLDEKVAVGGKNFSKWKPVFHSLEIVEHTLTAQVKDRDSFWRLHEVCSNSALPISSSWTNQRRISTTLRI